MSRPNPTIFLHHIKENGITAVQVCRAETDNLFVVLYQGQPFQLRTKLNIDVRDPGWKYNRVGFANSAHAFRLAAKLNEMFDTTDFTVNKMVTGENIPIK